MLGAPFLAMEAYAWRCPENPTGAPVIVPTFQQQPLPTSSRKTRQMSNDERPLRPIPPLPERRPSDESLIEKGGKLWVRPAPQERPNPTDQNPPPPPPPAKKS